jgi:hypothetical protein
MSLLKHLKPTPEQVDAVAKFEMACRALRDTTRPLTGQISPQPLWDQWWELAEKVRKSGLDPIDYANRQRG